MTAVVRLLAAGERAVLMELPSTQAVGQAYRWARAAAAAGDLVVQEIVPAARTVLLDGVDVDRVAALLDARGPGTASWQQGADTVVTSAGEAGAAVERTVEVPTRYDGPDLADVARRWDMTQQEVVRTHSGTDFVVAFCGFAPGFAYCTGLPPDRSVSRLPTPRPRVPAGSVGLAGEFTGIYPSSSPGGWRLVGRTELALWTPDAEPPATLAPGTRVRFTVVER